MITNALRLYRFYHNDACDAQQRVVVAHGLSQAIDLFMVNYSGVNSDTWTQKKVFDGRVITVVEEANGQHRHVDWEIDELEIKAGLVF